MTTEPARPRLLARTSPTTLPSLQRTLRVVVTMPAFHAARTLEKTLADLPSELVQQVIVVDDASTDDTVEVARRLGLAVVTHETNRGYGGNQKTCYRTALDEGADVVVMIHPDYQYDPKAVPLLLGPILSGDADMTFGSRFAGMSDPRSGGMPWFRYYGNRITTSLQNALLGTRFTELHSGMRAYTRDCLLSLPFLGYSDDFDFDAQLICDAISNGQRVVEVPIPTSYTNESSSIAIGASMRYVARSVGAAARVSVKRGRLGGRSPLARAGKTPRRLRARGPLEADCPTCGPVRHALVYPSTVDPNETVVPDEFTCTSDRVNHHDDIAQCTSCGILRALPNLTGDDIAELYEGTEDVVYLEQEDGRRELFEWVVAKMNDYHRGDKRLIEFGSHIGLFLDSARRGGWTARGVEPSAWSVSEGRARFGVDLCQGTIESVETPSEPYDAVVMMDMLEHVIDPLSALATAKRCLARDGMLVVSTINVDSVHARLRKDRWPWFIRPHLWYYTPETLLAHLDVAGFEAVEWASVPRWFNLSYVLERGRDVLGPIAKLLEPLAARVDPRIPTGWLGDIVVVIARPKEG
ncbi:MAG: bifunctional glycosyltransferase/class I SAM-dependent methyltransferase [Acidimicrobiia bacterium]|nr:bifunctional glycosyltransferase/class I SAM-dependent methyltransferase [Acidimicrobiia bacterium]